MSKITTSTVAMRVDVTPRTLLTWYKWFDTQERPDDCPGLPTYEQAYKGAPRFWDEEDVERIQAFKAWLPKGRNGVMGNINAKNWGDRGRRAQANKALKKSI